MHIEKDVEQFFLTILPATAQAGLTLQQAFTWVTLPQYRYIAYMKQHEKNWCEDDHRQERSQTIHYAIDQWIQGKSLPKGVFGPSGFGLVPTIPEEGDKEDYS